VASEVAGLFLSDVSDGIGRNALRRGVLTFRAFERFDFEAGTSRRDAYQRQLGKAFRTPRGLLRGDLKVRKVSGLEQCKRAGVMPTQRRAQPATPVSALSDTLPQINARSGQSHSVE
jgi:hypothetical protein